MPKFVQFNVIISVGFIFVCYCAQPSSNDHLGHGTLIDNYYKSTKRPYWNPFGYDTCRKGKFRFDWMRKESSFFCPAKGRRSLDELDDYSEYKAMGKPRIIEGFSAEVGEFPSFVQLEFSFHGFLQVSYCGGALLNEYLVLTAAHCLHNYTVGFAYAGSIHDLKGQRRAIKRVCSTKEYTKELSGKKAQTHDWAILEIDGQFELSRKVQPACVNFDYKLARDIKCVLVGFGLTAKDDKINSPFLKAAVVEHLEPYVDERGLIWTSVVRGEVGGGLGCPGDSGGPLYCYENCSGQPKMYVVGVAIFVKGTDHPCSTNNSLAFVNTVNFRKLMPSLIKEMMDKREKRSVRRLAPAEEMDSRPLSGKGFRCVDFEKPNEWE